MTIGRFQQILSGIVFTLEERIKMFKQKCICKSASFTGWHLSYCRGHVTWDVKSNR